jgi:hypothetical protein
MVAQLLGILIGLFFFLLLLKLLIPDSVKKKFCVLCFSAGLLWIVLIILYYTGKFDNVIFIALLVGGSVVGILHLLERSVNEKFLFFRLPMYVTLLVSAYYLLTGFDFGALLVVFILWVVFLAVFSYKNNARVKKIIDKVVECCKKW